MEAFADYARQDGASAVPDARPRDLRNRSAATAVKSSLRVLAVMEFFREKRLPARTSEISKALGIPNSSLDDILKTLVGAGYLSFDQHHKHYAPAYRIVTLARHLQDAFFGGTAVADLLDDIHRETGRTVWLCMQNDRWVQCVAIIPGCDYQHHIHIEGFADADWSTAAGLALLSCKTPDEAGEILKHMVRPLPKTQRAARFAGLIERVGAVRKQGFSTSSAFSAHGATAFAVPFQPAYMRAPVAIGLVSSEGEGSAEAAELVSFLQTVTRRHRRMADLWRTGGAHLAGG